MCPMHRHRFFVCKGMERMQFFLIDTMTLYDAVEDDVPWRPG